MATLCRCVVLLQSIDTGVRMHGMIRDIIKHGHLDCLKYAHENGYKLDYAYFIEMTIRLNKPSCFEYLVEKVLIPYKHDKNCALWVLIDT